MQDLIRRQVGGVSTRVGDTGGDGPDATGRHQGTHTEAIAITCDPAVTSFRRMPGFFCQIHDPTTVNRQGNDRGTRYRAAIFYTDDDRRRSAEHTIAGVDAAGLRLGKVVTEVIPTGPFRGAEPGAAE